MAEKNLEFESLKINDILSILVPSFIKNLMYKGVLTISKDQGDVAILFCDICDFDKIVVAEKKKLIYLLESIFRSFDKLCFNFKVQKIETVGKTYMACAGLKEYEYSNMIDQNTAENSTTRILSLAMEMIKHVKQYKWGDSLQDLDLKIGIHYGPVLAGVIGYHKPQFSLIGDTINTTSRICSTAISKIVTISEAAYQQLNEKFISKFKFIPNFVEAKGKGKLKIYQLYENLRSEDQIGFNKNVSSSPKHSFFMSPNNKKTKTKTLLNFSMLEFSSMIQETEKIPKSGIPEIRLNFGKRDSFFNNEAFEATKNKIELNLNTSQKNLIIEEENEAAELYSPVANSNIRMIQKHVEISGGSKNGNNDNFILKSYFEDFQNRSTSQKNSANKESSTNIIKENIHEIEIKRTFPLIKIKEIKRHFKAQSYLDFKKKNTNFRRVSSYPSLKKEEDVKRMFEKILEMLDEVKKSMSRHKKTKSLEQKHLIEKLYLYPQSHENFHRKKVSSPEIRIEDFEKKSLLEVISFESKSEEFQSVNKEEVLQIIHSDEETLIKQQRTRNIKIESLEKMDHIEEIQNEEKPTSILIPNFHLTVDDLSSEINPIQKFPNFDKVDEISAESSKQKGSPKNIKKISFMSPKNMQDNNNFMKIENNIISKALNQKRDSKSFENFQNIENEEIEEFYQCVEKKPQIIKNLNYLRKSIREKSAIDFSNMNEENREGCLNENRFTLSFPKSQNKLVETFRLKIFETNQNNDKFIISLLCIFLYSIAFIKYYLQSRYLYLQTFSLSMLFVISVIVFIMCFNNKLKKIYKPLLLMSFFVFCIYLVINESFNSSNEFSLPKLTLLLIYYGISQLTFLTFLEIILISITYFMLYIVFVNLSFYELETILILENILFIFWNLMIIYIRKKMDIDFFNKMRITDFEQKRLNEIIQYLLPPHVHINIFNFFINFYKNF